MLKPKLPPFEFCKRNYGLECNKCVIRAKNNNNLVVRIQSYDVNYIKAID